MSDITCPNCSATLPEGASFCTSCGQRLEAAASAAPSAPPAPPTEDATRVDNPGLHDSTQVIPPTESSPPAAGAWQPSASTAPPGSDWAAPPSATPPPAPQAEPQAWEQAPAAPPAWPSQPQQAPPTWGAPQQGAPGASTWGEPAPATSRAADAPSPVGGLAAVVGGALTLVGLFLSWFTLGDRATDSSLSLSGWDLATADTSPFESNDPYLLLALGILGLAVGVALFLGKVRPVARIVAIVVGAAVIAVVVRDWMSAADIVKDTPNAELEQEFGFFVPIVGGVALIVGGILPAKK